MFNLNIKRHNYISKEKKTNKTFRNIYESVSVVYFFRGQKYELLSGWGKNDYKPKLKKGKGKEKGEKVKGKKEIGKEKGKGKGRKGRK